MKRKQKRQDITASIQSFISYCHQRLHTHYRLILSSIRNSSNYRTEILPKSPSSSSYVGGRYPASPPTPIHHALPLRQQIGTRSTVMKSNQRRTLQVGLHPPNATTYRHGRSTCPVDTGEKAVDRTPLCDLHCTLLAQPSGPIIYRVWCAALFQQFRELAAAERTVPETLTSLTSPSPCGMAFVTTPAVHL